MAEPLKDPLTQALLQDGFQVLPHRLTPQPDALWLGWALTLRHAQLVYWVPGAESPGCVRVVHYQADWGRGLANSWAGLFEFLLYLQGHAQLGLDRVECYLAPELQRESNGGKGFSLARFRWFLMTYLQAQPLPPSHEARLPGFYIHLAGYNPPLLARYRSQQEQKRC